MKKLSLLLIFLLSVTGGYGQTLSSYAFNAFSCPYDSLTTSFIAYSGLTPGGGGPYDDCYYNSIPIGFNFNYCGTTYTSLSASANCWVTLGQTLPFSSSLVVNTYDDDLSNTITPSPFNLPRPILAPLWIDVVTLGPNVRYQTKGTAPNRVFVLEWSNCGFYNFSGSYPPHISVELILYETTNTIDFAYSQISPGSSSTGAEAIGITGGAGAYPVTGAQPYWSLNNAGASPTASQVVETRFISSLPATNQVYRWSYQCIGSPDAGIASASIINSCTSYTSTLTLDCSASRGYGIGYQWQSSPDSLAWTNVSGATIDSYVATVTSMIYYRCILTCSGSGYSDTTAGVKLMINTPPGTITGTTIVCVGSTTALTDITPGGSWSSGATTIATVGSGTGIVTGVSSGTTLITYKLPTGCYSTITVTVNPLPGPIGGTKTVCTGLTTTLSDVLTGGTWTSSITTVATIGSSTGVVTGVSTGTTTITYSKGIGAVCFVVTTVTVNPTPLPITGTPTVCVGFTTALTDATPGGTWTSTNTSVATVNPGTGVVTGVIGGTAIISYTMGTGCAAVITVTVNPLPSTITGVTSVCVGLTTGLFDVGGGTWSSSNTTIATVGSSSGIVTGVSPGLVTITYTLPTGCYATVLVTVNANPPAITGIKSVCIGGTSTLTDAVPGGTWSSFDPAIASINVTTGLMTGISGGTTTVTYTISTGCYATTVVSVNPSPSPITGTTKLCLGFTSTLSDALTGGTWSSSNTTVAMIGSTTGVVSGLAIGTSTITYTLATGCYIMTTVTVNALPAAIAGPTTVCAGATITLSDATGGGIWTCSNTAVATLSGSVVVYGASTGTAVITYTVFATGCIATTTITVSSAPGTITGTTGVCIGATTTLSNSIGGGTWTSSNTSVATAGFTTGVISGVAAGTATITYSLGGTCKSTITVTVFPLPAAITGAASVCVGSTTTLGGGGGGTWSSGATTIATVIVTTGVVTGVAVGTAVITYTLFPSGCTATKIVTVNPLPAAITGSTAVCIGGTISLSTVTTGGTWTSSSTGIATIGSSSGIVTGVTGGTATISYKLIGTGCITTAVITVTPPPPAITGTLSMCIGTTTTLSDPTGGGTWTSGNTSIATIGLSSGIATGVAAGTATITYIPGSGCAVTTVVTVNPFPSAITGPTSVCVSATILLSNSGGGTWSSSTTTIATIGSTSGIVTGVSLGTTTITYTLPTGCITTIVVTVSPAPVTISGGTNLCIGTTSNLTDAVGGGTWTSSNTSVATVGYTSGIVTGVIPGTATITYSLGTGCSVNVVVTVGAGPAAITGITAICIGATTTLSDATAGGTWSSSNTSVATIGLSTGIATGIAIGTATITYTKGCITITTVTVSPTPTTILGPGSVCQGSTIVLSDAIGGGTWTSGATTVATIGITSGVVSGVASGTSIITYSLGSGCTINRTITVNPVAPITGATNICTSTTTTLSNAVAGGTWSSSNTTIAICGLTTGVVTGLSNGSLTIVYTTPAGCVSSIPFTVNSTPSAITGLKTLCAGQTTTLSDAIGGGTWTSGTTTVATIGFTSGFMAGVSAGTSMITYSLGAGCIATTSITVNPSSSVISGAANVCAGSTITLSNATTGGAWTSGSTGVATIGATSGIVTGVGAGTTTITYTLPAGCSATKIITVNAMPALITGGTTICVGHTATLIDATPGGTWSGSPAIVGTIGLTSGIVTGTTPGIFTCVYSVAGCAVTTSVIVTPSPTTITGVASVCVGQTGALSNGTPGGTWSSDNTSIATINPGTGVATGVASGTVLIYYTLGTGCTVFTTIIVNPISPIIGGSIVCAGQTLTLLDTTLGGTWSSSNTTAATVGIGTGVVLGSTKGGITTIIYTSPKGCTALHTVTVTTPPPTITGTKVVCAGQTTTLTDPLPGGTWSTANTTIATVGLTSGVVTGISGGTAIISYSLGGCPALATVTVNPAPSVITGPTDVCFGYTITLSSSAGGAWSTTGTAVSVGATSGVVTGLIPGTATVSYSLPTGCFASTVITVYPVPTAIAGSTNLCMGGTTGLSDLTTGGTWSSSNTSVATIDGFGVVSGIIPGSSTIDYTVASGCYAFVTVIVNALPAPIAGATDVCAGATTTLSDVGGGTWSSSATTIATVGATSGVVTGASAGTATIFYTLGTGCATSVVMTVDPPPAAITGYNQVCVGYTTTLSDASPSGTWSSVSTATATIDVAGVVTGVKAGTSLISYTLGTGCASTLTMIVTPQPKPIVGNVHVCLGSSPTFTDPVPGGTWTSNNTTVATVGLTSGIVNGLSLGTADIIYTMGGGCSVSMTISVVPLPSVFTVTGGGNFCSGGTGVLIGLNGSQTATDYYLYKGSKVATGPLAGTGSAFDFGLQTVGGIYTVIATNTITGCSNTMAGSAIVTVIPSVTPAITIVVTPGDTVCSGSSATFTAVTTGGGSSPLYRWDVNGTVVATTPTYKFIPADGDIVTFMLTSDAVCATSTVVSKSVTMRVVLPELPSATLSTDPGDTICNGSTVTFTPVPIFGGWAPTYVWVVNGTSISVGPTFTYTPVNKDIVHCEMTSNYPCLVKATVPSNNVVMTVDSAIIPHVMIQASPGTNIGLGVTDTLTAVVTDAGIAPTYQWLVNGMPVPGATNSIYISNKFSSKNQDSVTCTVTSHGLCSMTTFNWVYIYCHELGIKTGSGSGNLTVLPNPNKGEFTIRGTIGTTDEELSIDITNLLGQVVYRNKIQAHNGDINERIKLSNTLANGMYILSVHSENVNEVYHMIIEQ